MDLKQEFMTRLVVIVCVLSVFVEVCQVSTFILILSIILEYGISPETDTSIGGLVDDKHRVIPV